MPPNRSVDASDGAESDPVDEPTASSSARDAGHLLQAFRQREAVRYLLGVEGPVRMCDVAEHVAAREHGTTVANLPSARRRQVCASLASSHLPMLEEAGVVEYDKPRGIVRPTAHLEGLRPALGAQPDSAGGASDRESAETERGAVAERGESRARVPVIAALVGFLVVSSTGLLQPGPAFSAVGSALLTVAATV